MRERTYRLVVRLFLGVFALLGLRFDIRGAAHLPTSGPAIVAANHVSYLDFALVQLAARRRGRFIRYLAKRSTFDSRVSGPAMRAMRHIPVDRPVGTVACLQAHRALRAGELVGIFPEATISRSWMLKQLKPGAAALAVSEQVPLVPVVTWGGQRVLTVDGRWSLRRGKAITILVGAPIAPLPDRTVAQMLAELRSRLEVLMEQAQRDYPDQPRDVDDLWWKPAHLGGTAPGPVRAAILDDEALAWTHARRPCRF